jgi:hypothetical protein
MSNDLILNKMKRLYIMMMLLLMGVIVEAQTSVWDGSRTVWTSGNGTASSPYLIESAQNLAFLAYMVNKGFDTEGLYFRLTTDIDLNGSEDQKWVPIGLYNKWFDDDGCDRGNQGSVSGFNPNTVFRGHFDGGEHSISNIYVDLAYTGYGGGLFGCVEGKRNGQDVEPAVIENVFVTSGYVTGVICGGIVGNGSTTTSVLRCWNGATVVSNDSRAGGIVGSNAYQVYNCYNIGSISGQYAGGIVGFGTAEIAECYNNGEVSGTYSGGIYGYSLQTKATINNCYNTGSIFADGEVPSTFPAGPAAGGIAGFLFRGNCVITNCYNVGTVSSTVDAGCILAYGNSTTLENNYYINTCSEGGEGTALSEDYMRSQDFVDCLNSNNSNPVWIRDVDNINDGFPILEGGILSVADGSETAFNVYPNPTNGIVNIEGVKVAQVQVYNILGQPVRTFTNANEIHIKDLPNGVYLLRITDKEGNTFSERIVKE